MEVERLELRKSRVCIYAQRIAGSEGHCTILRPLDPAVACRVLSAASEASQHAVTPTAGKTIAPVRSYISNGTKTARVCSDRTQVTFRRGKTTLVVELEPKPRSWKRWRHAQFR